MLNFGNKVENGGNPPDGVLTAEEINALVAQCNDNESRSIPFMEEETYKQGTLTKGKVWKNNNETAVPVSMSTNNGYGCMYLAVSKGDIVQVKTQVNPYSNSGGGPYHGTGWCVTNTERTILESAEQNISAIDKTLHIAVDGYVFINCNSDYYETFRVVRTYNKAVFDIAEVRDALGIKSYSTDDLTPSADTGGYYHLALSAGDVAPDTYTVNSGSSAWKCLRFPVVSGQKVTISTVGGGNARAYALTDADKVVLSVAGADADTTLTPVILEVEQDGYVYVNCKVSLNPNFYVNVAIDVPSSIELVNDAIATKNYAPHYKNNPLPLWNDGLKILAIGNSFTEDGTRWIRSLEQAALTSTQINNHCLYVIIRAASSLQYWSEEIAANNEEKVMSRMAGGLTMGTETMPDSGNPYITGYLQTLLAKDWDVIVIQQYSQDANKYSTFSPYLTQMISHIRRYCTNQRVAIAFQSVWSDKQGNNGAGPSLGCWEDICKTTREMMHRDGIDIIIPSGTAIQNARNTSLNDSDELTRDGHHLNYGVGRYIAACAWYQTLIAPIFGVSVLGNTATVDAGTPVTASNRALCQECAFAATTDMWNITDVEPEEEE